MKQSFSCIRTLRLKVKREAYPWLKAAAVEVNQVWNFANETSYKAGCPFSGNPKWLSAYDLNNLTAGAAKYFERIGSATIQRVNAEFATRRKQFRKGRLRWRVSKGGRRSLGWIPFKAPQIKRKGKSLRFSGKALRIFEQDALNGVTFKSGCFAEDSVGDWWLRVAVETRTEQSAAPNEEVGLDFGIKNTVATSDGEDRLHAATFYRDAEETIARLQRRGHKRQVKRLHRTVARRRKDALHKYSKKIVSKYQNIFIGDVSSVKLARTRMAKSVFDAGWGMLKTFLQYKGQQAGRSVNIISERNTTRTCSTCGALTGPKGLSMLVVRVWVCAECGVSHDRDVNAARNILFVGRSSPSICGNEPSNAVAEPSQTYGRCEAGKSVLRLAA